MKVIIDGKPFYISWRYHFGKKKIGNNIIETRTTTCVVRNNENVLRKANGTTRKTDQYDKDIIAEASIFSIDTSIPKSKDRKYSLDKVLSFFICRNLFSKEHRELIWNTYKATQHNNLSDDKLSLRLLMAQISKLPAEDKEKIRVAFFEQKLKDNVVQMKKEEIVAHA